MSFTCSKICFHRSLTVSRPAKILMALIVSLLLLFILVVGIAFSPIPIPKSAVHPPSMSGTKERRVYFIGEQLAALPNFSIVIYGDIQGGFEIHDRIVNLIGELSPPPQLLLVTGDSVQWGTSFSWWRFFAKEEPVCSRVPIMSARGNHDTTQKQFTKYYGHETHYTIVIPPMGILVVDTETDDIAKEILWVREALAGLAKTNLTHLVAAMHRPPFSSGWHGGDEKSLRIYTELANSTLPFVAVYTGHDHSYELIERDVNHPIPIVVFGGAGADTRGVKIVPPIGNFMEKHGFSWLHFDPLWGIVSEAIDQYGVKFDTLILEYAKF